MEIRFLVVNTVQYCQKKPQCFDSIFIVITVIKMCNSLQRHIILRCRLTHIPVDFRPSLLFIETDSIFSHLICLRKSINLTVFRVEKLDQNKLDFLKLKCSCLYYIYIFFLSLLLNCIECMSDNTEDPITKSGAYEY